MLWSTLSIFALGGALAAASETTFSVNDDLFAFPQYDITYSDKYILLDDAFDLLDEQNRRKTNAEAQQETDVSVNSHNTDSARGKEEEPAEFEYEMVLLHEQMHLCLIPIVERATGNRTEEKASEEESQKELARAADKGRELLSGMQGNQCLFYSTGWWTYSFCYNQQVRQFHALSPGQTGGRVWPPQEDPTTPAFVLGKVDGSTKDPGAPEQESQDAVSTELQTKAETSYLVQNLGGGTACDLTGKDRNIEIEFHCNPQLTDRIGWIKETSTCSYLMVVYTPRLCSDVAFLPPKESKAHVITCYETIEESQVEEWEALRSEEASHQLVEQVADQPLVVGDIQVGGLKYAKDGKKLERGRIVLTQDERAEVIAMQKDGKVSSISKADLRKLELDPADIEKFKKELVKLAGNKDWKIERLDDVNGQAQLRGIVSEDEKVDMQADKDKEVPQEAAEEAGGQGDDESGSEEEFREEI